MTPLSHNAGLDRLLKLATSLKRHEMIVRPPDQAIGMILAETIVAPRDLPDYDNAAVDGYAFSGERACRMGGRLPVVGRIAAGDNKPDSREAGAWQIFTGAPLPDNIDRIAMKEDCLHHEDGSVTLPDLPSYANCRFRGEDIIKGDLVLKEGQRLRMMDIASLAALGHSEIRLRAPLSVALLSSGNEIIDPGQSLASGQVYDANRSALKAGLSRFPVRVVSDSHCRDDRDALRQQLKDIAQRAQLIITTGGASEGDEDHFFQALTELGDVAVRRLRVKPGRPFTCGLIGQSLVLNLPGNPVAAQVCFFIYVRPALLTLLGADNISPSVYRLPSAFSRQKKAGRREFWRGGLNEDGTLNVYPRDGSGLISSLRLTQGLIEVPEDLTEISPGDLLSFLPYDSLL